MFILYALMLSSSASAAGSGGLDAFRNGDRAEYEYLENCGRGISISGTLVIEFDEVRSDSAIVVFRMSGTTSFQGPLDEYNLTVGYYDSRETFEKDAQGGEMERALRSETGSTSFHFENRYAVTADPVVPGDDGPDWDMVDDGTGNIIGVLVMRNSSTGKDTARYENFMGQGRCVLHVDPSHHPDNIRYERTGVDLPYFGRIRKPIDGAQAEVHSYTNEGIYAMDFSARNGFLTFLGSHDLFISGVNEPFYYRLRDTNMEVTELDESGDSYPEDTGKYLPAIFSIATIAALAMEVISGRFKTMEERKRGPFVLIILLLSALVLSGQVMVLGHHGTLLRTGEELFSEKYSARIVNCTSELSRPESKYVAQVNVTIRNTGERPFEDRYVEIVFIPERFGHPLNSTPEGGEQYQHEEPIEAFIEPGETATVSFPVPLEYDSPRRVDINVRVLVLAAMSLGDSEDIVLEEKVLEL